MHYWTLTVDDHYVTNIIDSYLAYQLCLIVTYQSDVFM